MHPLFARTFGGLSPAYYFRQFMFGLIFPALYVLASIKINMPTPIGLTISMIVNSLLYPYSRFVWESVIEFIVGNNIFIVKALPALLFKVLTMAVCFLLAIFIAPIGLIWLYFHHSKGSAHRAS